MTPEEFWGLPHRSKIRQTINSLVGEVIFSSESLARVRWTDGSESTIVRDGYFATPLQWYQSMALFQASSPSLNVGGGGNLEHQNWPKVLGTVKMAKSELSAGERFKLAMEREEAMDSILSSEADIVEKLECLLVCRSAVDLLDYVVGTAALERILVRQREGYQALLDAIVRSYRLSLNHLGEPITLSNVDQFADWIRDSIEKLGRRAGLTSDCLTDLRKPSGRGRPLLL